MVEFLFDCVAEFVVEGVQPWDSWETSFQGHEEMMYFIGDHLVVQWLSKADSQFLTNIINDTIDFEI